ncbi:hypothetical protein [Mannheimia sp. ZY171111]|uniref:hypothetical protein n=1 Tax=Mannheimia sp. ZY171111 TaxID=2679995 RepID=UPI001ADD6FE6|nr:hypothetical protein [Mannheimia sp. ZY171111]QTM01255.1 hypothetical protein GM698_06470 [Mannheimia sp. ZY171111]
MNDNCAFRVYFNRIAHDKYTYDNYDRVATRSFDTNLTKQGFERVETYHRDVYGRTVRTDNDIVGQGGDIDGYTTYDRNHYGQNNKIIQHTSDGTVTSQTAYEFDIYGRTSKHFFLDKEGNAMWTRSYEYNARGLAIRQSDDRGVLGKWDNGDVKFEYTRADDATGRLIGQKVIKPSQDSYYEIFDYDDFGRRILVLRDNNNDGKISEGEDYTRYVYGDDTANTYINYYYVGSDDNLKYAIYAHRDNTNKIIARLLSNNKEEFVALSYDGWGNPSSSVEDYTGGNISFNKVLELAKGKLEKINLSNATQNTEITLDNDVLAKLTKSTPELTLAINGDATDTVKLKDYGEFTKAAETVKIGSNTYDKLTTEVEGKTYTLLVDTDIKLFDAAHPGTEII